MTVQQVIDEMIKKTGLEPLPNEKTCDHLMTGEFDTEVTKIVTTFMATVDVIREAIQIGANFIITHEPTWFTGADGTEWLENDPVYLEKKKLIEEHHIAIWRFHDHMHMGEEDGIYRGFNIETRWEQFKSAGEPGMEHFGECYQIPKTTLGELCEFFKETLQMDVIQIVGNADMPIERVGVLVGGGSLGLGIEERPMKLMHQSKLDLLVCGDITEWTISAYVRDAAALGFNKAMLVLGHEKSEEMGMKYLGDWMKDITGSIEIHFVDSKEPFTYL
ncbi:Nif3-like dinuclear metal center hexameric protein [Clostridium boliviensis]|uniref:GTP cyclohydrolase 1 type 2 homolog n=1 Tax=Clostridium boliviensis TaxID=318465 RepID=A0ABU4GNE1_9CLOT|nr:Nif3-like dinuclear metal center hexameric protein [Clostridium boliviensis]MDW2798463.1 Nif3-like dinuclear metal center hexameric protein [Clostridium boliviensis]